MKQDLCLAKSSSILSPNPVEVWKPSYAFELSCEELKPPSSAKLMRPGRFASASASLSEGVLSSKMTAPSACPPSAPQASPPKVELKPASDVLAGAVARAASQGTIHPIDTLKVRLQTRGGGRGPALGFSKLSKLVPPKGAGPEHLARGMKGVASLYKGVLGAASGAGIYIGTYFAFYGAACNLLSKHTTLNPGGVAFVGGAIAAAGGSVVKVPLAVCIRSVQAGVYKNAIEAARSIVAATGPRGLFTGYLPTILEDVPDMAFKFAAYETLRSVHQQIKGRAATAQEDFVMGAISGAFAAAATTPLDVIKTRMMTTAASRPTMANAAKTIWAAGGPPAFFRGVAPRAISNGINSAVFFCFFEMLRASFKRRKEQARLSAIADARVAPRAISTPRLLVNIKTGQGATDYEMQPASATLAIAFNSKPRVNQASAT